jgi:hypothetical protein
MEFVFPWPLSQGEWMAWSSAVITVVFGLLLMFAPRSCLRFLRLRPAEGVPEAVGEARATIAGFHLGLGLSAMLLAQPLLYLALGLSWAFTAFGRLVSMLADRGLTAYNLVSVVFEAGLAALALAFAFGYVA